VVLATATCARGAARARSHQLQRRTSLTAKAPSAQVGLCAVTNHVLDGTSTPASDV
jgi:hypothetical protein